MLRVKCCSVVILEEKETSASKDCEIINKSFCVINFWVILVSKFVPNVNY